MASVVEFGIGVSPRWAAHDEVRRLVRLADEGGLDLFAVEDHPYQWRFDDTWTLLAYLAATTSRIRLFPDVANLPLRPPAMLAKAAATLDVLTGGRVELGLGAGAFWDAIAAMGGPRRTPADAVEATEEAIDVMRLVWSGQRGVSYEGRHYRLAGLHTGPTPAHAIGIWLGAVGPGMLDLVGRKADGWVPSSPWMPPKDLPAHLARIEDAAVRAGRDPASIRRVYNLGRADRTDDRGVARGAGLALGGRTDSRRRAGRGRARAVAGARRPGRSGAGVRRGGRPGSTGHGCPSVSPSVVHPWVAVRTAGSEREERRLRTRCPNTPRDARCRPAPVRRRARR